MTADPLMLMVGVPGLVETTAAIDVVWSTGGGADASKCGDGGGLGRRGNVTGMYDGMVGCGLPALR